MKNIAQQFDGFIRGELLYRYNANCGEILKDICSEHLETIPLRINLAEAFLAINTDIEEIKRYNYLVPQTRIKYSLWHYDGLSIKHLSYFDSHLVIIENQTTDYNLEVKPEKINSNFPVSILSEHAIAGVIGRDEVFMAVQNVNYNNPTDILQYFYEVIKTERGIHPLTSLSCSDTQKLIAIDKLWADLSGIDGNRQISIEELIEGNFENLAWLQELYLIFGWYEELDILYTYMDKLDVVQNFRHLSLAKNRYQSIRNNISNDTLKNYSVDDESFLSLFCLKYKNMDSDWKKIVLQKWYDNHFPILRKKVQRQIEGEPDEWIAFLLLAIDGGFWWKDQLFQSIRPNLKSKQKSDLLDLLVIIKTIVNVRLTAESMELYPWSMPVENFNINRSVDNISLRVTHKKFKFSSTANINQDLTIKINQAAGFKVLDKSKTVNIRPVNPIDPLLDLDLNVVQFQFNKYLIRIPLAWRQIELHLNECRIRFLRKKNRVQITIRFKNINDQVKIDGQMIEIPANRIAKIYYKISRRLGSIHIGSYNKYGVSTTKYSLQSPMLWLFALAVDSYGQISGICNFAYRGHSGYKLSTSNQNQLIPVKCLGSDESYTVSSRYCEPINFNLKKREGFSDKLFYSSIEELMLRMVVYLNTGDQTLLQTIRKACKKQLNFIPRLADISSNRYVPGVLGIIIDETHSEELIADYNQFSVIRTQNQPRVNYLFVRSELAGNIFSNEFFRSFLSEI